MSQEEPIQEAPDTKTAASEESAAANKPAETFAFQAEVQKVLALVIDSLYTNKEVFLRELISNASDALDKARFVALTDEHAKGKIGEPRIDIRVDEESRTVSIEDTGIGMTREEVVENLGTIARSGSLDFFQKNREAAAKNPDDALRLIGQFGVGFYAAFMVAERVDVETLSLREGASPVLWRSNGADSFTVAEGERSVAGTRVVLHLKAGQDDFLRDWRLKEIVQKYSDFVPFPIFVGEEKVSQARALWAQPKGDVSDEQHAQFFRHLTGGHAGEAPLLPIHFSIDAPAQFQALLYVPSQAPGDLFQREKTRLRLYAKRVLIMDECEKLTPIWLRFLRGVVDSEDLSLNVSREMLQETRTLALIEQQIVRQVLKSLSDLAESDKTKYAEFWRLFGKILKEGVSVDWKNKDAILSLCRFESMETPAGELIGLADYVAKMPSEQEHIYFISGPGRRAVEASPHLEALREKGFDVLFFTDPIDEWLVQSVNEYEKKPLRSVAHGDIAIDKPEPVGEQPTGAIEAIKAALGGRVKDVRFSKRLTESASCLVAEEGDPGANMERIMKMIDDRAGSQLRILEVNAEHPVIKSIASLSASEPGSPRLNAFCEVLYDQALLAEGVVEDAAQLTRRIQDLLVQATQAATAGLNPETPAVKADS